MFGLNNEPCITLLSSLHIMNTLTLYFCYLFVKTIHIHFYHNACPIEILLIKLDRENSCASYVRYMLSVN